MNKRKTLFIIQLEWPLQECLLSLVNPLSACGFDIHVFFDRKGDFADLEWIENINAHFHDLSFPVIGFWTRKSKTLFTIVCQHLPTWLFEFFLDDDTRLTYHRRANSIYSITSSLDIKPDIVIGVEKKGLICADRVSKKYSIPLVHFCLELFYGDVPHEYTHQTLSRELSCIRRLSHLIIQDSARYQFYQSATGITSKSVSFIPVSTRPCDAYVNSIKKNISFALDTDTISPLTFLYAGQVGHYPHFVKFIKAWNLLPPQYQLIMQVHGNPTYISDIVLAASGSKNVTIRTSFLTYSCLQSLIQNCDVGIAFYHESDKNQELIAYASQKTASYFQHGKPIITHKNKSFHDLFQNIPCGLMISSDFTELEKTIEILEVNYSSYSENSLKAHKTFFNATTNAACLSHDLAKLC
jgi:glycosyltransferase involved in cell wall biosynthesis